MPKQTPVKRSTDSLEPAPEGLESVTNEVPGELTHFATGAPEGPPVPGLNEAVEAAPALPYVGLDVFLVCSGQKPDQVVGFQRWATLQKLPAMQMPEWKKKYDEFMNRPVA